MSEETQQAPEQNYGPGNVLRAKREEYEWSVEAVAEALHLSTHSVKAIEADRYEDLPGATYVIGYWRSYARLLGIDIEETIEVNKRNLNIVTAEAAGLDINRAFRHKAKSGGKGGILLLILLAAFAYYAWQQQFFGLFDGVLGGKDQIETTQNMPSDEASEAAPVSPEQELEQKPEQKQEQVLRPLNTKQEEPVKTLSASGETSGDVATDTQKTTQVFGGQSDSGMVLQASNSDQPSTGESPVKTKQTGLIMKPEAASTGTEPADTDSSQNLLQTQTGSPAVADQASPQSSSQTAELTSDQTTTVQSASGTETMTLTLSKDSWLDIRDKTRTRLLYKTEKAGQTIDVAGIPPFYIYIGTPDGVKIRYRGKDVPFETHKTGMFARFKLDEEMLESL